MFTSDSQSIIVLPGTTPILPASYWEEYQALLLRLDRGSTIRNLRIYNPKVHTTLYYRDQ